MIVAILLLQSALDDVPPLSFKLLPPERCAPASAPDEILVCGRDRSERYRLRAVDGGERGNEPMIPKAEMRVFGNATLSAEGEQVGLPQGAVSNRAMIRLKMPF